MKNMFGRLYRSFLGPSSVVLNNDFSALVTSVGGHGGGHGDGGCGGRDGGRGDGGRGGRDGGRGDGRGGRDGDRGRDCDPPQRCSYCGINGHTEDYCWDK